MKRKCPNCNEYDVFECLETPDVEPCENDITICAYCGAISKFDKELNIVKISDAELTALKAEAPQLFAISTIIKEYNKSIN